jgi:hypothetical protein
MSVAKQLGGPENKTNRVEAFFSRLGLFSKLAIFCLFLAMLEGVALLYQVTGRGRPADSYFVGQLFSGIHAEDQQIGPKAGKAATRVNLGNLNADTALWHKVFALDPLLGWRNAKNMTYTNYGRDRYVTTPQGFMSIGDDDIVYEKISRRMFFGSW